MKKLSIRFEINKTFIKSSVLLVSFMLLGELIFRIPYIQNQVSEFDFFGSAHIHFNQLIRNARIREKEEGKIDCIFFGNSQTLYAIQPKIVEQVYFENTNKRIICQNFGVPGLSPISYKTVIQMLLDEFSPSIIIIGTNIIEYSKSNPSQWDEDMASSPWLNYKNGEFSFDGWLIENSVFYRYLAGFDYYMLDNNMIDTKILENGHSDKLYESQSSLDQQMEFFDNNLPNIDILGVQRDGLRDSLELQENNNITFVLLEMPLDPQFFRLRRKLQKVYPDFELFLKNTAKNYSVALWLTQEDFVDCENCWYDLIHTNKEGTTYFSTMLGTKLSQVDLSGN